MTDRTQRRADRETLRASPPDAGVIAVRHRVTGSVAVVATENLDGLPTGWPASSWTCSSG
jgi:hypothetical protein